MLDPEFFNSEKIPKIKTGIFNISVYLVDMINNWTVDKNYGESNNSCFIGSSPYSHFPFHFSPSNLIEIESDLRGQKIKLSKCPSSGIGKVFVTTTSLTFEFFKRSIAGPEKTA